MAQHPPTCSHRRSGGTGISDLIRQREERDDAVARAVKDVEQRHNLGQMGPLKSRRELELEDENTELRKQLKRARNGR